MVVTETAAATESPGDHPNILGAVAECSVTDEGSRTADRNSPQPSPRLGRGEVAHSIELRPDLCHQDMTLGEGAGWVG